MRKHVFVLIFFITLLLPMTLILTPVSANMSRFLDDTFNSIQVDRPKAFQGQQRGYLIGGGLHYRVPLDSIQPITFTPPHIKAGCGGIDVTMGAFSYLNFENLVQKLQAILQAAPALAFQLGLSTFCKECQTILSSLEQISNLINSLNTDNCRAAKALMGYAWDKFASAVGHNSSTGIADSYFGEVKKGLQSVNDFVSKTKGGLEKILEKGSSIYDCAIAPSVGGDPIKYKDCIEQQRNLLYFPSGFWNVAFKNSREYKNYFPDIIRAYYGDFFTPHNNPVEIKRIEPCPETSGYSLVDLVERPATTPYYTQTLTNGVASCSSGTNPPFTLQIKNTMRRMASNIKNGGSLNQDEIKLIESTQLPIYALLSRAVLVDKLSVAENDFFTDYTIEEFTDFIVSEILYRAFSTAARTAYAYSKLENIEMSAGDKKEILSEIQNYTNLVGDDFKRMEKTYREKQAERLQKWADMEKKTREMNTIISQELERQKLLDKAMFMSALRSK